MTKKGKIISLTALFLTVLLLFVFNNKQHKDRYPLVKPVSDFAKKQKTSIVQDSAKPEIKSCDFQYKKAVVSICEPDRVNFDIAKLPQKGKKHDVSTFGKDKIGFTVIIGIFRFIKKKIFISHHILLPRININRFVFYSVGVWQS